MKLYYSPGACSLSPHICLREAGAEFTLERVRSTKQLASDGSSYLDLNPLGYVPALVLPDGELLLEGPAIVQWIADTYPDARLAPANGTRDRYRFQSLLNFISTELHKGFSPLFAKLSDETKAYFRERLATRIGFIAPRLAANGFAFGEDFTAADAYLFTVLSWARLVQVELPESAAAYLLRLADRPSIDAAQRAEGLKKS